jgi:hypothetical protein
MKYKVTISIVLVSDSVKPIFDFPKTSINDSEYKYNQQKLAIHNDYSNNPVARVISEDNDFGNNPIARVDSG